MTEPVLRGTVDRIAGAVRLDRRLPAGVHRAFPALTDPARLAAWLAPVVAGRIGPDETFVLRMTSTATATCTVLDFQPPRQLSLRRHYTGEGSSTLAIQLSEVEDGTLLTLHHHGLPTDPARYGASWQVQLDFLAGHLAGIPRAAFRDYSAEIVGQYAASAIG